MKSKHQTKPTKTKNKNTTNQPTMDLSGLTGIEREVQKFKQGAYDLLDERDRVIRLLAKELYEARGQDADFCRCSKAEPSDPCSVDCLSLYVSFACDDASSDNECKIEQLPNLERGVKAARMKSRLAAHNSEGIPPPHRVLHMKEKKRCIRDVVATNSNSSIDLSAN
jgi:hypothetical protein